MLAMIIQNVKRRHIYIYDEMQLKKKDLNPMKRDKTQMYLRSCTLQQLSARLHRGDWSSSKETGSSQWCPGGLLFAAVAAPDNV